MFGRRRTDWGKVAGVLPPTLDVSLSLDDAHPYIRDRWDEIVRRFKAASGLDIFITCTYRSPQEQNRLYQKGRAHPGEPCWHDGQKRPITTCAAHPLGLTVTNIDGVTRLSEHNAFPARAIDVCVDRDPGPGKVAVWDEAAYKPLGPICEALELEWGGGWRRLKDYPHIQVPLDVL